MSKETEKYLEIKDLEVVYTQSKRVVRAVNHVSLSVAKGETLGLVGETGAGKTTIAKSIMRILPGPPARILGGEIWLDGQDLLSMKESDVGCAGREGSHDLPGSHDCP